ncbi:GIY-YIG nuclease family protein [Nevskia soli]|uniref:GIY-YIG nuclease family protein n=1 Tax=Nevskia soli TaxID=418856 RepID=UPI0015D7450B|nr:GIY-YIG nuclease family protein [Nevskia soli]
MNWVIYTLKNPRTHDVRYVGWTSKTVEQRLKWHIQESLLKARTHKQRWILSLLAIGLKPVIEVIESGAGKKWEKAERRWISHFRANGARLVNGTDGGDGLPNWGTPEERSAKQKRTEANKTPEQRSAIAKKAASAQTPEQRSASRKKSHSGSTPQERRARISSAVAKRTPEERRESAKKTNAMLTFEQRSAAAKKGHASRTPEERIAFGMRVMFGMRRARKRSARNRDT